MPVPRPGPGGAQNALQALQQKMLETQDALANETVEASAGGEAVTVVMTGQQKVQSIKISPDVFTAGDVEMLQDLIVAAFTEAMEKSQQLAASRMGAITGGLNLPGLL
ncbi:MAG: YbaB/EbfC family nucleoid-associated protein [Chloroflexi bacterium]|nr:YbaB/EbfC family nucleoid-associated protein [Chloroflexota bacterium]